ncbi:MAG: glutamate synthase subunit alpha, partial [Acidobacteria bacterium]|nr:glutamate synthase subunit alpha [Acidobacteriota bacterium]
MKNDDYQIGHDACGVGFITQLKGQASHEIVARALQALTRLAHRGGVDADGRSGDGAGLLMSIPDAFLRQRAKQQGIDLPQVFGLGMAFLPKGQEAEARAAIEGAAQRTGLRVLGWSVVPTNLKVVGPRAMDTLPTIEQCFVAAEAAVADMEAQLFRMRKEAESCYPQGTYFCSLSSRTVVYKGLLTPSQLPVFYPDLADPSFQSTFAIFHQRYSTNTAPSWSLAQPFRFVGHNGEINTISGNRRWLRARAAGLREKMDLPEHVQLLEARVSDSASFDNGLEIYLRNGYSPMEAMLSMVPPAWEAEPRIVPELRHFLDEQSKTQEPWDGPAAMIFSDGVMVGAKLDRNGLRPMRYTLTADGLLIVGSEVGIADLKDKQVIERQRLGPGEILLANPATGELLRPKDSLQLKQGMRTIVSEPATLVGSSEATSIEPAPTDKKVLASMGWSEDQFKLLFQPLVEQGQEAVWSMGDDAPPAALSRLPRPLWDYCKQRFAQVTNPPIDSLREGHLMSLRIYLGDSVVLGSPLLDAGQLAALEGMLEDVQRISATYAVEGGVESAQAAIERVQQEAITAATRKPAFVLLSDRGVDAQNAPLPSLLATAAVWKAMMQAGACEIPLIVETGQVIDTHHVALLIAAGASAVLPYLAMEQAATLRSDGPSRYRKALEKGLRKVISRMGISTIASYRNSQLFETIGLDKELCEQFFEDAHNSLGGKSLTELLGNALARHTRAYSDEREMLDLGLYRFRQNGEQHGASPELVRRMHRYIKSPTDEHYRAYAELANTRVPVALRDLLELPQGEPVPLEGVEEESSVLSRFSTQAMSLGAISPETHTTLAIAMNRLGARSNTGEGGEDPEVYREGSEANNRVKQIASGRFGVTADYLVHADELEIKMAQGAKPGEGGQ